MDILLLTTPAQHADTNPGVILQPKELLSWCKTLPTMDVIETVEMLKQAIHPFNEIKVNSSERLKLLEIYRNTFEEILSSYDELRLRTLPIAPEKRKVIAEDIMWLYLDLANGYKIIVKEVYETNASIKINTGILTSIYRAMELLLTSLIYATKAHAEPPQLVRLEIKQLYSFAESCGILDNKIKSVKDRLSPATIGNLFKQYLLFSTMKNDVFASEDILEFFTLLENFSTQTSFVLPENIIANHLIYKIDLIDDEPPEKISSLKEHNKTETSRFIDIQNTIETMKAITEQKSYNESSYMENKENILLKTYLGSLNSPNTTAGQQIADRHIKLANGIETVHYFLEHILDLNELFNSEISNGIEVQSISFDEDLLSNISDWILTEETDTARVLTANKNSVNDKIKINDFVALIQPMGMEQSPVFITGIIRKIREVDENLIKIGIEVLPGHPLPFSYIHCNGKEHIESGLYFPPISALKKPASLIINKNNFKSDMNCSIRINQKEYIVQPTNTILETNDFTQFNFSTLN